MQKMANDMCYRCNYFDKITGVLLKNIPGSYVQQNLPY